MRETWIDIEDYEGLYEVSNLGRVRTHKDKTTYTEKHGKRQWKQRILKFKGYTPKTGFRVSLWKNGKPKTFLVARLVAFNFFGEDINDRQQTVNHLDGNRMNNHLTNLEITPLTENIRHAFRTGLMATTSTILVDKKTNIQIPFVSMSDASRFLNKSVGYISNTLRTGKKEVGNYLIVTKENQVWKS